MIYRFNANNELAPTRGDFLKLASSFSTLEELMKKASEYDARINAGSTLNFKRLGQP